MFCPMANLVSNNILMHVHTESKFSHSLNRHCQTLIYHKCLPVNSSLRIKKILKAHIIHTCSTCTLLNKNGW